MVLSSTVEAKSKEEGSLKLLLEEGCSLQISVRCLVENRCKNCYAVVWQISHLFFLRCGKEASPVI